MKVIKLETEVKPKLRTAVEVNIAVAIMTDYGLELLTNEIDENCRIKLLIGIDLLTPVDLFKELLTNSKPNWEVRVFRKKAFFHPKLYIIKNEATQAYVGSGNFTKGGVSTHVELFSKILPSNVEEFEKWFEQYFSLGEVLSQSFIDEYEPLFNDAVEIQYRATQRLRKLKRDLEKSNNPEEFDLQNCNFSNQFFKFEHFNAFTGNKPYSFADTVNDERKKVKDRLFDLHDRIYPLIQKQNWDLHPHDQVDHIVSSHKHGAYTSEDLGALWLHYGRSPQDLKKFKTVYGENQTSMYQMRLQILVHAYDVCVWLRVGKNNGSIVDRTEFKRRMRSQVYRNKFFDLIKNLSDNFYITINHETRGVRSFNDPDELYEFVIEDDIRNEYFIIGRSYLPDDIDISDAKIDNSIIGDFQLLYPIYLQIRTLI